MGRRLEYRSSIVCQQQGPNAEEAKDEDELWILLCIDEFLTLLPPKSLPLEKLIYIEKQVG